MKQLLLILALSSSLWGTCTITSDSTPPIVASGATHSFTATCGTGLSWAVTGGGSINSGTGVYTAPSARAYGVYDRGAQLQPQNAAWNVPIDSLSVHASSSTWMGRVYQWVYNPGSPSYVTGHRLFLLLDDFYNTIVDNSSPQQSLNCFYNCLSQSGNYRIPSEQNAMRQHGWHLDPASTLFGLDFHLFTINKQTGENQEPYQLTMTGTNSPTSVTSDGGANTIVVFSNSDPWTIYSPVRVFVANATGSWAGFNNIATGYAATVTAQGGSSITLSIPFDSHTLGAAPANIHIGPFIGGGNGNLGSSTDGTINAEGASRWSPSTNAIPAGNGSDAPGSNMDATTLHMDEWNDALVQARSDVGHALRTTLSNGMISARDIWPSINGNGVTSGHAILSLTGVTNTNPATLTTSSNFATYKPCTDVSQGPNYSIGYTVGCTFPVVVSGFTGGCSGLNGNWTATAIDNTHASIPVAGCASLLGTPQLINDWMPYGTHIRYKSTGTSASTICSAQSLGPTSDACKLVTIYIATLKKYGMMMLDGTTPSDDWDTGVMTNEAMTDAEVAAINALNNYWGGQALQAAQFDQQLEIVDTSGIQITTNNASVNWMGSTENEVTVTVTGTGGTASIDLLLQGTTVGIFPQRLAVAQGASYQLVPWVLGNASSSVTYSVSPSITGLTVSGGGLISVGSVTTMQTTTVTICHATVTTACTYMLLDVVPVSSDTSYRLAFGQTTASYTDASSFKWWDFDSGASTRAWGQFVSNPVIGTITPFGSYTQKTSQWNASGWANPDKPLYGNSAGGNGLGSRVDILGRIILPAGSYTLTFLGEPGCSLASPSTCALAPNTNVADVEVQGVTTTSYQDSYSLPAQGAGTYSGYTRTQPATVAADGLLQFAYRGRVISTYGISLSGLLITPGGTSTVADPTFTPPAGTYSGAQSVTIATVTSGATLCYTSDGTTPTTNGAGTCTHGTIYTTPIVVPGNLTLKAIGTKSGSTDSNVITAAYIIVTAPHLKIGIATKLGTGIKVN